MLLSVSRLVGWFGAAGFFVSPSSYANFRLWEEMAIITILAAEAIRIAAKATCKELITLFHGSWIVSARITVMEHGSLHSNEETLFCVGTGEFVRAFKRGISSCEAKLV